MAETKNNSFMLLIYVHIIFTGKLHDKFIFNWWTIFIIIVLGVQVGDARIFCSMWNIEEFQSRRKCNSIEWASENEIVTHKYVHWQIKNTRTHVLKELLKKKMIKNDGI